MDACSMETFLTVVSISRSRIIAWKDRVGPDNFAVNSEEAEYYRRSAG